MVRTRSRRCPVNCGETELELDLREIIDIFIFRDLREEMANVQSRELELSHKKSDLEKQLEVSEAETLTVKNELKIALRRIEDLQTAIGGEMDSDDVCSDQVNKSPRSHYITGVLKLLKHQDLCLHLNCKI